MVYMLFKFLHIVGASVWVGGVAVVTVLNLRLGSEKDERAFAAIAGSSATLRRTVIGPAAMLTLIAGGLAMAVAGMGFNFWIIWGLAAIAASIVLGVTVARRGVMGLTTLARTAGPGDPAVVALQRRVAAVDAVFLLLMLSTVAMMVFKPML